MEQRVSSAIFTESRRMNCLKIFFGLLFGLLMITSASGRTIGSSSVFVSWNANPEPDIAGYKIHYGTSTRSYDTVLDVGPSTAAEILDLEPGVPYFCALTAYNDSFIESDYSVEVILLSAVSGGTTETGNRIILVEAEDGDLTLPMVPVSDGGTGWVESAIYSSEGATNVQVTSSQDDEFHLWIRVIAPDSGQDSYFVSVDGGPEEIFHVHGSPTPDISAFSETWVWRKMLQTVNGEPRSFSLSAGSHSIRFRSRESGPKLDRIVLSSDPDFVPGDSLPRSGDVVSITGQPAGSTISEGTAKVLNVDAVGTGPLQYQWRRNGVAISGATSPSLVIQPASSNDTGTYTAYVWTGSDIIESDEAQLIVVPSSDFKIDSLTITSGQGLSFSVQGGIGANVTVLASSDLTNWTTVGTVTNTSGTISIDDPGRVGQTKRFYKLVTP